MQFWYCVIKPHILPPKFLWNSYNCAMSVQSLKILYIHLRKTMIVKEHDICRRNIQSPSLLVQFR